MALVAKRHRRPPNPLGDPTRIAPNLPALAAAGTEWAVDISEFQGHVNMAQLRDAGAAGVIIRSSIGTLRADRLWAANRAAAEAAGLPWIAYHFCYPGYNSASAEAAFFDAIVGGLPAEAGLAADFEDDPAAQRWPSGVAAVSWARTFLSNAGPADYSPLWYASPSFASSNGLGALASTWRWWVAHYGVPHPTTLGLDPVLWQQTDAAQVPGVPGRCDLSVMLRGAFRDLLYRSPSPSPSPEDAMQPILIAGPDGIVHTAVGAQVGGTWVLDYTSSRRRLVSPVDRTAAGLDGLPVITVSQWQVDRLLEGPQLTAGEYDTTAELGLKTVQAQIGTAAAAVQAQLDHLVTTGGVVDLGPLQQAIGDLQSAQKALGAHLGMGTP